MSWYGTHLIHKRKAIQLLFHFSLHLRSLFLSISIRFTFMLSIHSFLSSCCQVLGCGMRKGRVSSLPLSEESSLRKRRQRPNRQRKAGQRLSKPLTPSSVALLWSFLFRLVLRRWLLWYATEVFQRICATSKKRMVNHACWFYRSL